MTIVQQTDTLNSQHVHNWLMDVPGFPNNYSKQNQLLSFVHSNVKKIEQSRKERPMSISSVDSINLDELINANFTTDMKEETDLTNLSSIDLDDSNEDFWKLDSVGNQPSTKRSSFKSKSESNNDSYSKSFNFDDLSGDDLITINLNNLSIFDNDYDLPGQLPNISNRMNQQRRFDRSGSFSSENSNTSQSTVNSQQRYIQPIPSTSTSSANHYLSKSTHSSFLPRSYNSSTTSTISNPSENKTIRKKPSLNSSRSDNTESVSSSSLLPRSTNNVGLARRASHIPAPTKISSSNLNPSIHNGPIPQRTLSTASILHKKSSTNTLPRSSSRVGQLTKRASHIPSPPARSTTSLGISSLYSASDKPQHQFKLGLQPRPNSSLGSTKSPTPVLKSNLRTSTLMRSPTASKSTALKMNPNRSFNK